MNHILFVTKNTWAYYERHCRGKIKHKTAGQASGHAKSLNKTGEEFGFYQCRFCKNFHVGHNKTNPKNHDNSHIQIASPTLA